MATTAHDTGYPTLVDMVKRKDPDGAPARLVEMLTKKLPLLEDMAWKEGNLDTGEQVSFRMALPGVGSGIGWLRFNEGLDPGKSTANQFVETCGRMSGLSVVDKALADLNGGAPFRMSEDQGFVQAMSQELEASLFYASTRTAPEEIHGMSPRLDTTTANPAATQIIKHTGSPSGNDQASMWFVVWGLDTVYGIIPKGSVAGLKPMDLGVDLEADANGKRRPAYRTWWDWYAGLCVKDWRYLVRLCNIDTSALSAGADDLIPKMIDAYAQLQDVTSGRLVIYCNRFIWKRLWQQARYAGSQFLTAERVEGKPVMDFMGAPIRVADSLTNAEAAVS